MEVSHLTVATIFFHNSEWVAELSNTLSHFQYLNFSLTGFTLGLATKT